MHDDFPLLTQCYYFKISFSSPAWSVVAIFVMLTISSTRVVSSKVKFMVFSYFSITSRPRSNIFFSLKLFLHLPCKSNLRWSIRWFNLKWQSNSFIKIFLEGLLLLALILAHLLPAYFKVNVHSFAIFFYSKCIKVQHSVLSFIIYINSGWNSVFLTKVLNVPA